MTLIITLKNSVKVKKLPHINLIFCLFHGQKGTSHKLWEKNTKISLSNNPIIF
jgi:hypothetical protein